MRIYQIKPLEDRTGLFDGTDVARTCPIAHQLILSLDDAARSDYAAHRRELRFLALAAASCPRDTWRQDVARTEALLNSHTERARAMNVDMRELPSTAHVQRALVLQARARALRAEQALRWGRAYTDASTRAEQLHYACAAQHAFYSLARSMDAFGEARGDHGPTEVLPRAYPPVTAQANREVLGLIAQLCQLPG